MIDPLAEMVALLQPGAPFAKVVEGAGPWRVRRTETGRPFYCALLEGACCLQLDGREPIELCADDFVLVPSAYGFTMSSLEPEPPGPVERAPVQVGPGEFRVGRQDGPAEVRLLVGYCTFGSPDTALLVSLLPKQVHVRGEPRLATLVRLVGEESRAQRPAREVILARLLEVLLIEAFRSARSSGEAPGLLRGLADDKVAVALRHMHGSPARPWTVAQLAKAAALSRSAFFDRFSRAVGVAPMEYLLAWRMALAKDLLRRQASSLAEVAQQVGYGSASAFSVAFTRQVGLPPSRYRRHA